MAIAKGTKDLKEVVIKRYIGVAGVKIKYINPTLKERNEFFNTQATDEPIYNSVAKVRNSKGEEVEVKQARITFLVETDPKLAVNNGIDLKTQFTIFINNSPRYGKSGKVEIIDKYGRTAWATVEEVKAHKVPEYKNGPASIDKDYRAMYIGEDELVDLIKCFLGIDDVEYWDNSKQERVTSKTPEDCVCQLEHIKDYFSGNVSEIKEAFSYQPDHAVKILLGVRSSESGAQYQDVFRRKFIKISDNGYSKVKSELANDLPYMKNVEFSVVPLQEYKAMATDYSKLPTAQGSEDNPYKDAAPEVTDDNNDLPF